MKSSVRHGLILLVCLATALLPISISFAAGPYMSISAGGTWLEDADLGYNDPFLIDDELEFDTGFNVGLAGGYDYGMTRLEAEIAYRMNDVDQINSEGETFSVDGDISALSFMLNGYLDLVTGSPVTPYIGAGLGVANVAANRVKVNVPGIGELSFIDDDDTVFAYQFSAGIAFALDRSMALDLGYRYFATLEPEFDDELAFGGLEAEYNSHNVSLGLRINF